MYHKKAHIHFVGIGGIGMSGIATILKYQGYEISGCDLDLDQQSVQNLKALGCTIYHGNNTPECHTAPIDILVYSSAIKAHDDEIIAAQQRGIPTIPRALMLAELMRTKYSIAIAGAHGKTTTTSLISHILMEAHRDPTIVIGGHLKNISANARFGTGDFLVAEADESDRSLVHLQATLAVVTNIDLEHLDVYKDLDDIKNTFVQFLNGLPFYGKAFMCIDDANVRSLIAQLPHIKMIKYGLDDSADVYATDIDLQPAHSEFVVWKKGLEKPLGTVHLAMPGRHNVLNGLAALAVALDLGVSWTQAANALTSFKGIERRFSYRGGVVVVDIGAQYEHYCADLTRTYPVSGTFSARQRQVYTIVLETQDYIANLAKPGMWLSNKEKPDQSLNHLAKKYLTERGYGQYFPHGIGHFLGLDVHDVGDATRPLQEGDVITIEPGIYIPQEQIGVRIEDDYWIVSDGVVCLSEDLPKSVEEVEAMVQQKFDEYEGEDDHEHTDDEDEEYPEA